MKDYYSILEVHPKASFSEIKSSYKRLVKIFHPDRANDNQYKYFEEKLKEINEAYSVLKDDQKRTRYDYQFNKNNVPPHPPRTTQPENDPSIGVSPSILSFGSLNVGEQAVNSFVVNYDGTSSNIDIIFSPSTVFKRGNTVSIENSSMFPMEVEVIASANNLESQRVIDGFAVVTIDDIKARVNLHFRTRTRKTQEPATEISVKEKNWLIILGIAIIFLSILTVCTVAIAFLRFKTSEMDAFKEQTTRVVEQVEIETMPTTELQQKREPEIIIEQAYEVEVEQVTETEDDTTRGIENGTENSTDGANSSILFADNFEDAQKTEQVWKTIHGEWEVVNGTYFCRATSHRCLTLAGDLDLKNYKLSLDMKGNEGVDKFVYVGFIEHERYYWLKLRSSPYNDLVLTEQLPERGITELQIVPIYNSNGNWYHFDVIVSGNSLQVYIDNRLIMSASNLPHPIVGRIGIGLMYSSAMGAGITSVYFDNVKVVPYP